MIGTLSTDQTDCHIDDHADHGSLMSTVDQKPKFTDYGTPLRTSRRCPFVCKVEGSVLVLCVPVSFQNLSVPYSVCFDEKAEELGVCVCVCACICVHQHRHVIMFCVYACVDRVYVQACHIMVHVHLHAAHVALACEALWVYNAVSAGVCVCVVA